MKKLFAIYSDYTDSFESGLLCEDEISSTLLGLDEEVLENDITIYELKPTKKVVEKQYIIRDELYTKRTR